MTKRPPVRLISEPTPPDVTKQYGRALAAFRDLGKPLVQSGQIDLERLPLTMMARADRRIVAKDLSAKGLSTREIAKVTGAGVATIHRDLNAPDGTKSVPNGTVEDALRAQLSIAQRQDRLPDGQYGTVVIDPPWPMKKIEREVRPNQVEFDYPTMEYDDIRAYGRAKILPRMAKDCHVFMWTTQRFLPMGLRLFEDWDGKYVLTMVWHKPGGFQPVGLPQYNCEFVLYGRIGSPEFIDTKQFDCCFMADRHGHSRKPAEFYELLRRVTPEGRIDFFGREQHPGFDQAGNEAVAPLEETNGHAALDRI